MKSFLPLPLSRSPSPLVRDVADQCRPELARNRRGSGSKASSRESVWMPSASSLTQPFISQTLTEPLCAHCVLGAVNTGMFLAHTVTALMELLNE